MDSIIVDQNREEFLQEQLLLLKYKVQETRLEKVWKEFLNAGFDPILIKGWATALKYPNPAERLYVDIDLIFNPSEFEGANNFALKAINELPVDLHNGARHLDSFSFEKLYENSVLVKCGETNIRILSEEDHLRILCVHWLNDGGSYKEKLWDIYYAVDNRRVGFDWDKCLNVVEVKRRKWIITAIALAHRYFGLKVDDLPFKNELDNIPKWVIRTVEREWSSDIKLMPLHYYLNDKKGLWEQIKKRIPPNAIQATIEVNGSFDNTPRIFYQVADIFKRTLPSIYRIRDSYKISRKICI